MHHGPHQNTMRANTPIADIYRRFDPDIIEKLRSFQLPRDKAQQTPFKNMSLLLPARPKLLRVDNVAKTPICLIFSKPIAAVSNLTK